MPQSLSQLIVHLVFSTKLRAPLLAEAIREELRAFLIGVLRERDCPSIMIGSVDDHIHILFVLSKNMPLSKIVGELKAVSSRWIKSKGPSFRAFQWQSVPGLPPWANEGRPCGARRVLAPKVRPSVAQGANPGAWEREWKRENGKMGE